jgi:hypothetical protein
VNTPTGAGAHPRWRVSSWAWTVAEHHLAQALPQRWAHVQGVARVGARVGRAILTPGDAELLLAAALLHDIGYAAALVDSGYHPLDGARFVVAQRGGYRLAGLVAHHSAASFVAEIGGLGDELAAFDDEHTALRDALWYSDMHVGPAGEPVTFDKRIAEIRARHGPGSPLVRALDAGALDARRAAVYRTQLRLAEAIVPGQVVRGQAR